MSLEQGRHGYGMQWGENRGNQGIGEGRLHCGETSRTLHECQLPSQRKVRPGIHQGGSLFTLLNHSRSALREGNPRALSRVRAGKHVWVVGA